MSLTYVDAVREHIRAVPDFPKKGILFRDFTPVLKDAVLFEKTLSWFQDQLENTGVQYIVGVESRGFILGAALASRMKIGFVPARKMGKLPGLVEQYKYDLEYGSDCIEMHVDSFPPGSKIAVIDDLLATGGTIKATLSLCQRLEANVVNILFMMELIDLNGRNKLPAGIPVISMINYSDSDD